MTWRGDSTLSAGTGSMGPTHRGQHRSGQVRNPWMRCGPGTAPKDRDGVCMCNGLRSCFRIGPFDPLNTGNGKSKRSKIILERLPGMRSIRTYLEQQGRSQWGHSKLSKRAKNCETLLLHTYMPLPGQARIHTCPPIDDSGHRHNTKR